MEGIICAICRESNLEARMKLSVSALPCGHVFHSNCVEQLFLHAKGPTARCPTCRGAATKKQVKTLFFGATKEETLKKEIEHLGGILLESTRKCVDNQNVIEILWWKLQELQGKLLSTIKPPTLALARINLYKKTKELEAAKVEAVKLKEQLERARADYRLRAIVGSQEDLKHLEVLDEHILMRFYLHSNMERRKNVKKVRRQAELLKNAETKQTNLERRVVELEEKLSALRRHTSVGRSVGGDGMAGPSSSSARTRSPPRIPVTRAAGVASSLVPRPTPSIVYDPTAGPSSSSARTRSPPRIPVTRAAGVASSLVPRPTPSIGYDPTAGPSSSTARVRSPRIRVNSKRTSVPSVRTMPGTSAQASNSLGGPSRLENIPPVNNVTSRVAPKRRRLN